MNNQHHPFDREVIFSRDGWVCVATLLDKNPGPCYDKWGERLTARPGPEDFEADYVRRGAIGGRHQFSCDHVTLCAGHHRGAGPTAGIQWATSHRRELREYLQKVYPGHA